MFTKIKLDAFVKSILFFAIFLGYCAGLYYMRHRIQESQRIITDYAAFTALICGYLWGCFSTYSFLDDMVIRKKLLFFTLKIKRRTPIILQCGILLIGYIGYALGIETTHSIISEIIFNIATFLTPVTFYLCVKKPCLHH